MSDDIRGRFSVSVEPEGTPHYHSADVGMRLCSLVDECDFSEPPYWMFPGPAPIEGEIPPAPDWSGWTEMGYQADGGLFDALPVEVCQRVAEELLAKVPFHGASIRYTPASLTFDADDGRDVPLRLPRRQRSTGSLSSARSMSSNVGCA